jgi:hypothetical protein
MLDAIDSSPAGSVSVMVLEDGADDDTEHRMIPFIEKFRSIKEAVKQFGRI